MEERESLPEVRKSEEVQRTSIPNEAQLSPENVEEQSRKSKKRSTESEAPISGPTLDLSSIISETSNILLQYRVYLNQQKTRLALTSFYLLKLNETLADYLNFVDKLINFFYHHSDITTKSYVIHCNFLPTYGDYRRIIKETPNQIRLPNISSAVAEADVRKLVDDVTDNFYAEGTYELTMFKISQNINHIGVERRGALHEVMEDFPHWFNAIDNQIANNEKQSRKMFEKVSFINFLNSGINEEPLSLKLPVYQSSI